MTYNMTLFRNIKLGNKKNPIHNLIGTNRKKQACKINKVNFAHNPY